MRSGPKLPPSVDIATSVASSVKASNFRVKFLKFWLFWIIYVPSSPNLLTHDMLKALGSKDIINEDLVNLLYGEET